MIISLISATVLVLLNHLALGFSPPKIFENSAVSQSYDVSGGYVRRSCALTIKNIDKEAQSDYYFGVSQYDYDRTSIIEARVQTSDVVVKIEERPEDFTNQATETVFYKLTLPTPLESGEEINVILAQAFVDYVRPFPETGLQADKQFLLFNGSKHAPSAYLTRTMLTRIKTRKGELEELEKDSNDVFDVSNGISTWGPYYDIPPYSYKPLLYRFEFSRPLPKVTKLTRDVWVSHWGTSVSFEETYWLKHAGTKIKGAFSRIDFQRLLGVSSLSEAALRDVSIALPPNSRDIYYTDLVGNVSTSVVRHNTDGPTELSIRPRYPILGGWGYNFTIGWSNDADQLLKKVDLQTYLLKIPLLDGPFDVSYDNVHINIVLPEGAKDVEVLPPRRTEVSRDNTFSYLDTIGRPTVRLSYRNMVDSHRAGYVYVSYKFSAVDGLRKPLTVAATIASMFLMFLLISKVDLTIDKEHNQTKTRKHTSKSEGEESQVKSSTKKSSKK